MSLDQPPKLEHQSLESLRKIYQQRLDAILDTQLTVDNIKTFAKKALDKTVQLTDDILDEYRNNPNVHTGSMLPGTKEQEDEALIIFNLPDIPEILQSIIKVVDIIDSLKTHIQTHTESINKIIVPPQPGQVGSHAIVGEV